MATRVGKVSRRKEESSSNYGRGGGVDSRGQGRERRGSFHQLLIKDLCAD